MRLRRDNWKKKAARSFLSSANEVDFGCFRWFRIILRVQGKSVSCTTLCKNTTWLVKIGFPKYQVGTRFPSSNARAPRYKLPRKSKNMIHFYVFSSKDRIFGHLNRKRALLFYRVGTRFPSNSAKAPRYKLSRKSIRLYVDFWFSQARAAFWGIPIRDGRLILYRAGYPIQKRLIFGRAAFFFPNIPGSFRRYWWGLWRQQMPCTALNRGRHFGVPVLRSDFGNASFRLLILKLVVGV